MCGRFKARSRPRRLRADCRANQSSMTRYAPSEALHRVATARKSLLDNLKEGESIQPRTGRTIEDLRQRATADRMQLAAWILRRGKRMVTLANPSYRDSTSRFYYAMYHAIRAVVFFQHHGDDHEQHSTLPTRIPDDFPNRSYWQNQLKIARGMRNAADYDIYPKSEAAWRRGSEDLQTSAIRLLPVARSYLRSKGCGHV